MRAVLVEGLPEAGLLCDCAGMLPGLAGCRWGPRACVRCCACLHRAQNADEARICCTVTGSSAALTPAPRRHN